VECANFRNIAARNPERVIAADWGRRSDSVYSVDLIVEATDRQGLLRDISDVLSREKINVTAVKTQSRNGSARMGFTVEVPGGVALQKTLTQLREVAGVIQARRS
jgi:GTP pyrophosphokinase